MQEENTEQSSKKDEPATIGQRLRGPSGRKPSSNRKEDYLYPGKRNTTKVQSEAKVQSQPNDSFMIDETMSERDQRREDMGKVRKFSIMGKEEIQELLDWVNTSTPTDNLVRIDSLSITQRHLKCLTNPYLEDKEKYLGDEVIISTICFKVTLPVDTNYLMW